MSCPNTSFDCETGRFSCKVSGDECVFLIPDKEICAQQGYIDTEYEQQK